MRIEHIEYISSELRIKDLEEEHSCHTPSELDLISRAASEVGIIIDIEDKSVIAFEYQGIRIDLDKPIKVF